MPRHPSTEKLLRWFDSSHLPPHLAEVVQPVRQLAWFMADTVSEGPELSAGLRKLLEAKDCFVRAAIELKEREDA